VSKQGGLGAAAFIAIPLLLVGTLVAGILLIFGPAQQAGACGPEASVDPTQIPKDAVAGYSGDQLTNAAYIMNAASALNLDRAAQIIGVMTAMGESSLHVLDHGDTAGPDSRGLFQQRDNGAWGSLTDRMDPTISAINFFNALERVDGWEGLAPTIAAHRVQGNADPYHYEKFYAAAATVVGALAGKGITICQSGHLVFPLNPGYQLTSNYGPRAFVTEGASLWHAGDDLQHYPNPCHDPVFAITDGTVTLLAGYQLSIKSPDGYTVSYLHMYLNEVLVKVGDQVTAGEQVGATGSNGPSTGCHLHLAISVIGNTNPAIADLPRSESTGGPTGFVDPEQFYDAFGLTLCAPATCRRTY
jgi:murein DD-endopeptidase MepM/ murein hydrolase activator NlpD